MHKNNIHSNSVGPDSAAPNSVQSSRVSKNDAEESTSHPHSLVAIPRPRWARFFGL